MDLYVVGLAEVVGVWICTWSRGRRGLALDEASAWSRPNVGTADVVFRAPAPTWRRQLAGARSSLVLGGPPWPWPCSGPFVTAPRYVVPGATYLVTRRCSQRWFFLRPSEETNAIFKYAMAVAAERTGVEVHVAVMMSNHWHGLVTDPRGDLPKFFQVMHRLIANAMNAVLGRSENFWSSYETSAVSLETADDVLDKMAYVIANPTQAGLVEEPHEWPGLITTTIRQVLEARRPGVYFRAGGLMLPEVAKLLCTVPPVLRGRRDGEVERELVARVRARVAAAKRRVAERGERFLGAEAVRQVSPWGQPATDEPRGGRKPAVAARDATVREQMIRKLTAFRQAYRSALDGWRRGDRGVVFPFGSYLMCRFHRALCGVPLPAG